MNDDPKAAPATAPTLADLHKRAIHFLLSHVQRHGDGEASPAAQRHLEAIALLDAPPVIKKPAEESKTEPVVSSEPFAAPKPIEPPITSPAK